MAAPFLPVPARSVTRCSFLGRRVVTTLYIDGKKNNSYPNWRNGYYLGEGPDSSSFTCHFSFSFNSNTIPVALWSPKDPTVGRPCRAKYEKWHYHLIMTACPAAIAAVTNNVYMGTNYPSRLS